MTRASDFPALRQFFEGYLHEDFMQEYGSPVAALRAFIGDANGTERRRLAADAKRLLVTVEAESLADMRARLTSLGARWSPRSRASVITLLTAAAETPSGRS
jgi:hypothetical protein